MAYCGSSFLAFFVAIAPHSILATLPRQPYYSNRFGSVRRLNGDSISSITPKINFAVTATGDGDVCTIGCEGNYADLTKYFDNLEEEVEAYFHVSGRYAVVTGTIYSNWPDRVQALISNHSEVKVLVLLRVMGSADDAANLKGLKLIHAAGLQTCIPSDGAVASGGTDLFLAGPKRSVATPVIKKSCAFGSGSNCVPTPGIGIHSWAVEADDGTPIAGSDENHFPRDHQQHQEYLKHYDEVCIPIEFYWKTLKYGLPMHYITEKEIATDFSYMRDCSLPCTKAPTSAPTSLPTAPTSAPTGAIIVSSAHKSAKLAASMLPTLLFGTLLVREVM